MYRRRRGTVNQRSTFATRTHLGDFRVCRPFRYVTDICFVTNPETGGFNGIFKIRELNKIKYFVKGIKMLLVHQIHRRILWLFMCTEIHF
ncbi:unnamed protein product [Chrysodeixis includens]|uniref:Uncharacterized protein n=1 Tax=Chrysodeixis includens TaxID=689277 RepID=A0A9N8KZ52_CHRIL|nr:unnamed protein product [Chrysodeixis includens]